MKKRVIALGNMNGMSTSLTEVESNTMASDYLVEHYEELITEVQKMGIRGDNVHDLIQDVYLSLVKAERSGEGYDMSKGKDGRLISVPEFVIGRLKGYSKNVKYRSGSYCGVEIPSTACEMDGDENLHLDSFQAAYLKASNETDEIADLEEYNSVREQIKFCMTFDNEIGFSILNLLKNADKLVKLTTDKTLFYKLSHIVKTRPDFSEALNSILNYGINNKDRYQAVLAEV